MERVTRPHIMSLMIEIQEEHLYQPLHEYLVNNGYSVNAEVGHCDIIAQKDGELVVIELKKTFSLKLVYQAIDRQKISDSVYVALPLVGNREYPPNFKHMTHLLKRLELGLILIHFMKTIERVEVVLHPRTWEHKRSNNRKAAILRESNARIMELNTGGSAGKKRLTLYRQQNIEIAVLLNLLTKAAPRELVALGCTPKCSRILTDNHYGWFCRVSRGVYTLHSAGRDALNGYPDLVTHFTQKYSDVVAEKKKVL